MASPTLVNKLLTGIEGFDHISNGGLPRGRTTLVSGTAGSAKTLFAVQYLAEGIKRNDEAGVFVTFEESPHDIRQNMASMGWDIATWEAQGRWAFIDASPQVGEEAVVVGDYDLGALLARIENAVHKINATRVSLDSLGAIFARLGDAGIVRAELFRIASVLKQLQRDRADDGRTHGRIRRYCALRRGRVCRR